MILLPHEVVHVVPVFIVLVATPKDQKAAVSAILGTVFFVPVGAENPVLFTDSLASQWRSKNGARRKVNDRPTYASGPATPDCETVVPSKVRWLLGSFPKGSPKHTFFTRSKSYWNWRTFPRFGDWKFFKSWQRFALLVACLLLTAEINRPEKTKEQHAD